MAKKKVSTDYECEYCGAKSTSLKLCKEHEIHCKKSKDKIEYYASKTQVLSNGYNLFYAESLEELEDYIYMTSYYTDGEEFENYTYPCIVLTDTYERMGYYDDYSMIYMNIRLLDDFLKEIEVAKKELLDQE